MSISVVSWGPRMKPNQDNKRVKAKRRISDPFITMSVYTDQLVALENFELDRFIGGEDVRELILVVAKMSVVFS